MKINKKYHSRAFYLKTIKQKNRPSIEESAAALVFERSNAGVSFVFTFLGRGTFGTSAAI
jgi:hypothetical protein